jgi:hypothetical protein
MKHALVVAALGLSFACGTELDREAHRNGAGDGAAAEGLALGGPGECTNGVDPAPGGAAPSIVTPLERQVIQRSNIDNRAAIRVMGDVPGGADCIEAMLTRTSDNAPISGWHWIGAGAHYDALLRDRIPAGGWYRLWIRAMHGGVAAITTVERVGVGEVYVTAGQSNIANTGIGLNHADDRVSAWTGTSWVVANDPQPIVGGIEGSIMPIIGNRLVAALNVPVAFISVAVGGTAVSQWLPGGPLYPRIHDQLMVLGLQGQGSQGVRAILWHQGEADVGAHTKAAQYRARLQAVIDQSRVDAASIAEPYRFPVRWVVALVSYAGLPASAVKTKFQKEVAKGHRLLWNPAAAVYQGPTTDDMIGPKFRRYDGVGRKRRLTLHMTALGLQTHGNRWADVLLANPELSGPR